jgi:hypothetical protein
MDEKRALLRHTLATVAYRGGKVVRDAPASFATFQAGDETRSPAAILAHIGDLLDWGLSLAKGAQVWHNSTPLPWDDEVARFFDALTQFDDYLASESVLVCSPERLFQGPIADALTHIGQIAMLRRLAGTPIKGENYYRAEIASGRVTRDQAAPRQEFA